MKLRNVTFISILVLATLVMAAEFIINNYIVLGGFEEIEREHVTSNIRRAKNEVVSELQSIDRFLFDWSSWDDTYQFAQDGNTEYIQSNLHKDTFTDQSLNVIIVTNENGEIVYGRALDQDGMDDDALLQRAIKIAQMPQLPLIRGRNGAGGLVQLPTGTLMLARRPILRTNSSGPPIGHLVMAALLTAERDKEASERLELDLKLHSTLAVDSNPDLVAVRDRLEQGKDTITIPRSDKIVDGYALMPGIDGKTALLVQVTEPRTIYAQGQTVARFSAVFIATVMLVFSGLVFYLLQKRVISRVESLNNQMLRLDMSGNTHTRLSMGGLDEISQLGSSANRMLYRIEEDHTALIKANDELEENVRKRTAELEKANEELLQLDKAKSHFLASASHELRTPLTAIHGFIKLMERNFKKHFHPHLADIPEIEKRIDKHLENYDIVRRETDRLGRLIGDLLDLNKIEAGMMEWRDADVTVEELTRNAIETIKGQLAQIPSVDMDVEIAKGLPVLHVDRDRIHQVLINLLNNAAKFTSSGHVKLVVALSRPGWLEFSVEDTGSGIPKEDQTRIFDIFYQSEHDGSASANPFGTGLGLAICKEIVEHYEGEIWVESEVNEGSSFKFTLPLK